MTEYDIVIRGGTVVDGTGAAPRVADVGIRGDRIVAVDDSLPSDARHVIDATDRLVTPGFFDPHTHLDAQIGWDPTGSSVCWHGITSVVLGNCGVTFAPCPPDGASTLAAMMEAVEDIPATTILGGLPWDWDGYDEYLRTIDGLPKGVNVGGMVGHCAVRSYVMGVEESLDPQRQPTDAEVTRMQAAIDAAIEGGALGLSTSRTLSHQLADGRQVPGTFAKHQELFDLCEPLRRRGVGVFESAARFGEWEDDGPDNVRTEGEVRFMGELSRHTGRPVTFNLFNHELGPKVYRRVLDWSADEVRAGAVLRPQIAPRRINILRGLAHNWPFHGPAWDRLRDLDLQGRVDVLDDPARCQELIDEVADGLPDLPSEKLHLLGHDLADYEYDGSTSLLALSQQAGETPVATFVRIARESRGRAIWVYNNLNHLVDGIVTMITDPNSVLGLGDTGAHVGYICDSSLTTYVLSHWVRDVGLLSLPEGVRRLTSDPAHLYGQIDRGVVRVGAYADLNVIDLESLAIPVPEYRYDFPGGAGRWVQEARGYDHTLVNGRVFMDHGTFTGETAGHLMTT